MLLPIPKPQGSGLLVGALEEPRRAGGVRGQSTPPLPPARALQVEGGLDTEAC